MTDRPNRVKIARRKPGVSEPAAPTAAAAPEPTPTPTPTAAPEPAAVVESSAKPKAPAKRRRPSASAPTAGEPVETFGGRSVQYAARLDSDLLTEWRERVQATGRPQRAAVIAAVEAFIGLGEDEADRRILDVVQAAAGEEAKGPAVHYSVRLPEELLTRWKALVAELARSQNAAFTAALCAFLEHDAAAFDRQIRRSITAHKDAA